jgi:hypothetical protein
VATSRLGSASLDELGAELEGLVRQIEIAESSYGRLSRSWHTADIDSSRARRPHRRLSRSATASFARRDLKKRGALRRSPR